MAMQGNGVRRRFDSVGRAFSPQLLICDVDNTLYDFGSYYEAGLRGFVPAVAERFTMSEIDVLATLRQIYDRHKSIEYPYALEDFSQAQAIPMEGRRDTLRELVSIFWNYARKGLIPYPHVHETLAHLKHDGVNIVAFTDAPQHEAWRRLKELGVDRYLDGFVATDWLQFRRGNSSVLTLSDVPGYARPSSAMPVVGRLSGHQRKPNSATYTDIMTAYGVSPEQVTVVGDSPARDLAPAHAVGMRAVWARYGMRDPATEPLLQQVVPFRLPEVGRPVDLEASGYIWIDDFAQLADHMIVQQRPLPVGDRDA